MSFINGIKSNPSLPKPRYYEFAECLVQSRHFTHSCWVFIDLWAASFCKQIDFESYKEVSRLFELTLGNHRLDTCTTCTTSLGIHGDSHILFREQVSGVKGKWNFALLLLICIRSYLHNDTVIKIYKTFSYPRMINDIEFYDYAI